MGNAILVLTDGTERIDMLNVLAGFSVADWRQAVAALKGGGTWQSSSLSNGRQLVDARYDNTQESFPIQVVDQATQDNAILVLQNFFRLSTKAQEYWTTDWQSEPVWIESRAEHETNTRYCIVYTSTVPDIADIYSPTFMESATLPNMMWLVERGHWGGNAPGMGTAVELSAVETYDGRNLGNVDSSGDRDPTTADEVYVANRRNEKNLTHIFTWSAASGFSANLMDAALPFNLIDDVALVSPQVNDCIYFGIQSAVWQSAFSSLVFDIGIAQAGLTLVWEMAWGAAVWNALVDLQDNTNQDGAMTGQPLDTTGVNSVAWSQFHTGGGVETVNGVLGPWVRLRITAVGAIAIPTQQNRDIYSVIWPYTEIQSDAIGGDIPSLLQMSIFQQYDKHAKMDRLFAGLRSVNRGDNFTAYLNCADIQNPANVTVAAGANTVLTGTMYGAPGRAALYTVPGAAPDPMATRVTITIDAPLTIEYYGQFRVFLRIVTSNSDSFNIRGIFRYSSGGTTITSTVRPIAGAGFNLVDLGAISIPGGDIIEEIDEIAIEIQAEYLTSLGGDFVFFLDVILLPVDEWAAKIYDPVGSAGSDVAWGEQLIIDSISLPKVPLRTFVTNIGTGRVTAIYGKVANDNALLQANARQRLWFTFGDAYTPKESPVQLISIQASRNQRYLGPRGGR